VLDASPTSLLLTFAELLGQTNTVAASCNGSPFRIGSPSVSADGLSLTVNVPNPMPRGSCNVIATVSAPDSTPNGSVSFSFEITTDPVVTVTTVVASTLPPLDDGTTATTPPATATTAAPADGDASGGSAPNVGGPLGLARLTTSLALGVLLGALVLIVTAWPEGIEYILTVRFLRTAWVVGLVGSVLTVVFLTSQVTGRSVGGSLNPSTWIDLKELTPGLAALARIALVAACGWVVLRPERCIDPATQLPALAIPGLAVATFGFSRTGGELAILGMVGGVLHAIAMAVWLGGVVLLARVVLAGPGEDDLVQAVRGFGRLANPALLVTVLTGAFQTWRLDRGELFGSGHGRVALLKVLVVAVIVFVGLATRQFVRARLRGADEMTAPLASRLRRATGMEAAGGVVVLMLSAWLLAMTPGNLAAASDGGADYGYRSGPIVRDDLDVAVSLTGELGANAVRIDVAAPVTGLANLTLRFVPPAGSTAPEVHLTVPPALAGTGAAVLEEDEGIPLPVAGVWTMILTADTPTGPKTEQRTFQILSE
jgi:putative copper export protein